MKKFLVGNCIGGAQITKQAWDYLVENHGSINIKESEQNDYEVQNVFGVKEPRVSETTYIIWE